MVESSTPSALRVAPQRLWQWAQTAFAQGAAIRDLVTAIYGADLPRETYVFARSWPKDQELPVDRFFHPWALLRLSTPHGTEAELDEVYAKLEKAEVEGNDDFLPLMSLQAGEALHDGYVIGYSIGHLRRADSAIFGHLDSARSLRLERLGDSLLEVLHAWMSDYYRMEKAQVEAPENRRRAPDSHVKAAAQWLKELEKLQRKVAQG